MQYCFSAEKELDDLIEQYREVNNIPSKSKAIETLIRIGLERDKVPTYKEAVLSIKNATNALIKGINTGHIIFRGVSPIQTPTQPPVDFTQQPMQQQNP